MRHTRHRDGVSPGSSAAWPDGFAHRAATRVSFYHGERMRTCETQRHRTLQHDLHSRRPGTRSRDRRHHHADLSDLDLRAGGPRPAQGLRVRPHAESDAHGARAQRRRHRSGHRGVRVCLGHGGHRRPPDAARVRRSRRGQRQHLRRHVPPVRARAPQVRPRLHLRRHVAARADRAGDHSRTRSTCSSRRRPTRCCTSPTSVRQRDRAPQERPRRRRQHLRQPVHPAAADARRRHRRCTARRSSSTATATASAASSSSSTRTMSSG